MGSGSTKQLIAKVRVSCQTRDRHTEISMEHILMRRKTVLTIMQRGRQTSNTVHKNFLSNHDLIMFKSGKG